MIETNIRSVFLHHFFRNKKAVLDKEIIPLIKKSLPTGRQAREWYWALMDYGTHLKKTVPNPNRRSKHYARQSSFKGSRREIRGKVIKLLLEKPAQQKDVVALFPDREREVTAVLQALRKEGFIRGQHKLVIV